MIYTEVSVVKIGDSVRDAAKNFYDRRRLWNGFAKKYLKLLALDTKTATAQDVRDIVDSDSFLPACDMCGKMMCSVVRLNFGYEDSDVQYDICAECVDKMRDLLIGENDE